MIIFGGGSKNLILIILVVLFTGFIVWQWAASEPFAKVEQGAGLLSQIKNESTEPFQDVKDSIDQGKESVKTVGDELAKKAQRQKLLEETQKYLEDKEAGNLKSPSNKEECEAKSAQWNEDDLKCYLATTDGGTECSNGVQCQGYCATELSEIYDQFIVDGQSVETNGVCSVNIFKYGCLALVEEGWVNGIICID